MSLLAAGAVQAPAAQERADDQFRNAGPGPLQAVSSVYQDPASDSANPPAPAPGETIQLSDEKTLSRWAFVREPTAIYRQPDASSASVGRLRLQTFDRTPELVLALSERTVQGEDWVEVRFKVRPNNLTGWVRRDALGSFKVVTTFLKIKRKSFRAVLFRSGRRVWSARIGVGRKVWPTPAGHFYVRERLIPTEKNGTYGVFAFGTSATSPVLSDWPGGGIIGIHGTDQPYLIPGRISHGCIRVRNAKISRLRHLMPLGTPILIV